MTCSSSWMLTRSLSVLDDPDRLAAVSLTAFSQSAQLAGFRISQREKEAGVRILRSTSMWCRESGSEFPPTEERCFRYRVEIAGIDVTPDLVGTPSVSETLDPIIINEYRVNEASIVLRNEGGKYNSDLAGNFWETHGLNAGGFQNAVKIYTEHFENGSWVENLLFTGLINESFEPIGDATFKLNCTDISSRLRKALAQDFGTLEKWDALRKQSDEDSFEGTYIPERSLLPMQIGTGMARSDRTDLHISRLELPSEGTGRREHRLHDTDGAQDSGRVFRCEPVIAVQDGASV